MLRLAGVAGIAAALLLQFRGKSCLLGWVRDCGCREGKVWLCQSWAEG